MRRVIILVGFVGSGVLVALAAAAGAPTWELWVYIAMACWFGAAMVREL